MTPRIDAGAILAQESIAIGPEETAGEVEARLASLGARLALQVTDQIQAGTARALPQDPARVTNAPKLKKENGALDWTRSAAQVCCQVRAMHPWPTAYTFWHRTGQPPLRLIVHRAAAHSGHQGERLAPGQVLVGGDPNRLCVGAGGGEVVEVLELQPAGKKRMSAAEFLHGHRPQAGDRLGPEGA